MPNRRPELLNRFGSGLLGEFFHRIVETAQINDLRIAQAEQGLLRDSRPPAAAAVNINQSFLNIRYPDTGYSNTRCGYNGFA